MKALLFGYVVALIAAVIGWVMNIIALVHMFNGDITPLFIGRIVGIFFAPLGAILGYL